jgi:sugar phosphate isomerase/epimerase
MVSEMNGQKFSAGVIAATFSTDAREAAHAARAAGFSALQFDAVTPALDLTELSQTGRREFRHVLSSNDQQLISLRVDVGPKGFGPGADIDRLLGRFEKVMDAAKGLGAPLVCVEAGPLPEPAVAPKPKPRVDPAQAGLIIIPPMSAPDPEPQESRPVPGPDPALLGHIDTALFELGVRADRIGVTLALRSELSSFAALDRAIAAARCPWFGVDLDPVAMLRDAWSADEIFSRFGDLIRHVRARDATAGSDRRTRPAIIGQGSTHWGELLANLDSAGYRGWLTIDALELSDRIAAAITGAKVLRTSAS